MGVYTGTTLRIRLTIHVWQRCGLMSDYFDHLLLHVTVLYVPDSRIKCWAFVVWFVAVTFICDHPDIQAISFVGSDRAVSFSFLFGGTYVVYMLLDKSLKVFKFSIESSKALEVLKAMVVLENIAESLNFSCTNTVLENTDAQKLRIAGFGQCFILLLL